MWVHFHHFLTLFIKIYHRTLTRATEYIISYNAKYHYQGMKQIPFLQGVMPKPGPKIHIDIIDKSKSFKQKYI